MKIEVCYSPELIGQFDLSGKTTVVIDVLRATSCMVAGLGSGVAAVKPVASIEECLALGEQGYIMAGERNGKKVEAFDIGNSPFDYQSEDFKGKKIAATTTNGTKSIALSEGSSEILVSAFLNLQATVDYLSKQNNDIVLFCAGWKGRYNLEDSLLAGAIVHHLKKQADFDDDAPTAALFLYESMQHDLLYYISRSNHAARLSKFGIMRDIEYCSQKNLFDVVPKLVNGELVI